MPTSFSILIGMFISLFLCMSKMKPRHFHQLRRDLKKRIERSHRILKYHRDTFAANFPHLFDRNPRTSMPSKTMRRPAIFPGGSGISRITERLVTDLPLPDSPTMPSVSPFLSSKLMPSTALTMPSSVAKYVLRPLTDNNCAVLFAH